MSYLNPFLGWLACESNTLYWLQMASHTYLTMPSSNLRLCSRSWCWTQHSWLMSTRSHRVFSNLTNAILTAPCRLASALLRVYTTSSDTGSPLSASFRTRSHCHQTSQSSPSLLPMSLLLLLSCCFWPKLLLLLTKAPAVFDQSSHYFFKLRFSRRKKKEPNLFWCGRSDNTATTEHTKKNGSDTPC